MLKLGNFLSTLRATAALPFAMAALTASHVSPAVAQETVLYTFQGSTDGGFPSANLIADSAGNLYGTTRVGGASGDGVVFELAPNGTETVLYSFTGGNDGSVPFGGLIRDKAGNLYGTTYGGGTDGAGVAFELVPDGTETVLYTFTGGSDGGNPYAGLIKGKGGELYGTTEWGGANNLGTVFELTKSNGGGYTETVLHAFGGSSDGANPAAGLIEDKAGNLYGTTIAGGSSNCGDVGGCGTVFEVASDGTETVLHSFAGGSDGKYPYSPVKDKGGNLYGTTAEGGSTCDSGAGCGTVFELTPDGTETVLHAFTGGSDGWRPYAGLIEDGTGNFYSTTALGGGSSNCTDGCGTVFKITPKGKETVLYAFTGSDGSSPYASLIKDTADGKGDLFGTAYFGGTGNGVVFEIKK